MKKTNLQQSDIKPKKQLSGKTLTAIRFFVVAADILALGLANTFSDSFEILIGSRYFPLSFLVLAIIPFGGFFLLNYISKQYYKGNIFKLFSLAVTVIMILCFILYTE